MRRKLRDLKHRLLEHSGGVTFFPQPSEGFWKMAGVTYRDEIVVFRVLATEVESARSFRSGLKQRLRAELRQEEILSIEREVATL